MEHKLLKDLIKTRKAVRKKCKSLKSDKLDTDTRLKAVFKPITDPLKEIIRKREDEGYALLLPKLEEKRFMKPIKQETAFNDNVKDVHDDDGDNVDNYDDYVSINETCKDNDADAVDSEDIFDKNSDENKHAPMSSMSSDAVAESGSSLNRGHKSTAESRVLRKRVLFTPAKIESVYENLENSKLNSITKLYLTKYINSPKNVDTTYGLRYKDGAWMIGDSIATFKDRIINIKDKNYNGTPGLYELLVLKKPRSNIYNQKDLHNYKKIVLDTNAHKRNYDMCNQINGCNSDKYRKIISTFLQYDKGQSFNMRDMSMINLEDNREIRYVYWNDPNELVDRLRLLRASFQTGHTNHNNEIMSIIEELREGQIIY